MGEIIKRRRKGSLTLDELTELCGITENQAVCKLIRISKKTDEPQGKFNLALFEEVNLQDEIPKPLLVKVDKPEDIPGVVNKHLQNGKQFIFDSTIFVENQDARVLGFR